MLATPEHPVAWNPKPLGPGLSILLFGSRSAPQPCWQCHSCTRIITLMTRESRVPVPVTESSNFCSLCSLSCVPVNEVYGTTHELRCPEAPDESPWLNPNRTKPKPHWSIGLLLTIHTVSMRVILSP
ncbi:hypothetical protein Tco_0823517 [Tanacetum coccineum]|uniref:Uncharacterized protein n=1 Tax=Tanacetum coccineum TaxID=301880 RepID=A0ABQ5AJ43_9ASTR